MRFNLRIKKRGFTFFNMLAVTQTIQGVTNLVVDECHNPPYYYPFWDLEGCSLRQAENTLRKVQLSYGLSDIFIVSDMVKSYRAWCFCHVDFETYLKILLDTDYVDYSFFYYTVKRRMATLRISDKKGRLPQKVVSVLHSYFVAFPKRMRYVVYDTGLEKKGYTFNLGDKLGGEIG